MKRKATTTSPFYTLNHAKRKREEKDANEKERDIKRARERKREREETVYFLWPLAPRKIERGL